MDSPDELLQKSEFERREAWTTALDACTRSLLLECLSSLVFSMVLVELWCNMRAVLCLRWLRSDMYFSSHTG